MEVEEFFDLGAAVALQTWTTAPDGNKYGSEKGEILFCKVSFVITYVFH